MAFTFYGQFFRALANKEIDFDSDSIKAALVTSSYTFNHDTHAYFSDITGEVVGTGYTAGGVVMGSPALSYVAANSWSVQRANATAYTKGQVVRPATANGLLYLALTDGTSGAGVPTWPTTIGATVTDGTVTWLCAAKGALLLTGGNPSWSNATLTTRGLVLYDSTPATNATRPLIGYNDFGSDQSVTGATFTALWSPPGIGYVLVP